MWTVIDLYKHNKWFKSGFLIGAGCVTIMSGILFILHGAYYN